jgi:hypothetical protein
MTFVSGTTLAVEDQITITQSTIDTLNLSGSACINLSKAPGANGGSGLIIKIGSAVAVTQYNTVYFTSAGDWDNTDAGSAEFASGLIGYTLGTSSVTNGVMLQGTIYKASHGFSIGAPLFLSTTPGAMTTTAPTGGGDIIRVVGYAISASQIYFDPAKTWVEKATP